MRSWSRRGRTVNLSAGLLALALGGIHFALPLLAQDPAPKESTEEAKKFLADWAARLKDVKSLRVDFTQTKTLKILRHPLVSKGVVLLKGQKLLMSVDAADGSRDTDLAVDVARGEARILYPRQHRLEVFEISKGGAPETPFPFFGGDVEKLPSTHRVTLEQEKTGDETRPVLVLAPRDPASAAGATRMTFVGGQVARVQQTTRAGETLVLEISKFEVGAEIPDASLELVVPEGTEVVHPLAKAPQNAPAPSPGAADPGH